MAHLPSIRRRGLKALFSVTAAIALCSGLVTPVASANAEESPTPEVSSTSVPSETPSPTESAPATDPVSTDAPTATPSSEPTQSPSPSDTATVAPTPLPTATPTPVAIGDKFAEWYRYYEIPPRFGKPVAAQVCASATFCTQEFEDGTAYWNNSLGAHGVSRTTAVGAKYFEGGGYAKYGMPEGDLADYQWTEPGLSVPGSTQQLFDKAIIVAPDGAAAFVLDRSQPIVQYLQPRGSSDSGVRWLSPVQCGLAQGGCSARFVGYANSVRNRVIVQMYSLGTSVRGSIAVGSPEWTRWRALGGEAGQAAGYPLYSTCDLTYAVGYCKTTFQHASIYTKGTSLAVVRGAMFRWDGDRVNVGLYGAPLSDERCGLVQKGCSQEFARGTVMWTPTTGAQPVAGAIRTKWRSLGGEKGYLGYPTAVEQCFGLIVNSVNKSGCYQRFQHGMIWWSKASGARAVRGAVLGAYQRANYVWADYKSSAYTGKSLGYPIGDEQCTAPGRGCYQWFQNGMIWWSPTTGAQRVMGPDAKVYQSLKWAWGRLGYPTTEEKPLLMGRTYPNNVWGSRQFFQHGYLTWHPRYGVTVTYR
ncbi:uncharacterized protein with LGFP repeats [Arthrobacter woluwensis]|nr:uncharacterized protein with LGFP repeats [Arthrobacter woluwensis]